MCVNIYAYHLIAHNRSFINLYMQLITQNLRDLKIPYNIVY
jgi:hypothetical protein